MLENPRSFFSLVDSILNDIKECLPLVAITYQLDCMMHSKNCNCCTSVNTFPPDPQTTITTTTTVLYNLTESMKITGAFKCPIFFWKNVLRQVECF